MYFNWCQSTVWQTQLRCFTRSICQNCSQRKKLQESLSSEVLKSLRQSDTFKIIQSNSGCLFQCTKLVSLHGRLPDCIYVSVLNSNVCPSINLSLCQVPQRPSLECLKDIPTRPVRVEILLGFVGMDNLLLIYCSVKCNICLTKNTFPNTCAHNELDFTFSFRITSAQLQSCCSLTSLKCNTKLCAFHVLSVSLSRKQNGYDRSAKTWGDQESSWCLRRSVTVVEALCYSQQRCKVPKVGLKFFADP